MNRRIRGFTASIERSDRWLMASVGVLLFMGIFVVYGAGSYIKGPSGSPLGQHYIIARHLTMIGIGLVAMITLMNIDYRWFRLKWVNRGAVIVTFGLVAWTLFISRPTGSAGADINRWVSIAGFRFQPVEMAKVAMIFFFAERLTQLGVGRSLSRNQVTSPPQ